MDRSADEQEVESIRATIVETPCVVGAHDIRTRKMGDLILGDVHLEVSADISVERGHTIAVEARQRILKRHRVLNVMPHVDSVRQWAILPCKIHQMAGTSDGPQLTPTTSDLLQGRDKYRWCRPDFMLHCMFTLSFINAIAR